MLVCFLLQVEPQFFRRNKFQPPLSIGSAIKQNSKLEFFEVQPNSSKHIETLQAVFINVSFQSISGYRPRFNHRDLHYIHPHSPPKNNKQYSLISVVFAKTSDFGGECLI